MSTIGAGKIAPFGADGKSIITGETDASGCPNSLPTVGNCAVGDSTGNA